MNPVSCSIFFHNYYGGHEEWVRHFSGTIRIPFTLFYNIVGDSVYNHPDFTGESYPLLADKLQKAATGESLQKIVLRRSPNQGKDIGGKLVLLDAAIREEIHSDYSVFLHDKKSPYKVQSQEWKDKLFRIIKPDFVQKALAAFEKNKETGIVAAGDSIHNEYDPSTESFISNNRPQLLKFIEDFNIHTMDYRYVAGTMFWARTAAFSGFFRQYPPLEIRKMLEKGNVMDEKEGTNSHAWERLLCWLIFAQGYSLKGF